jgi:diguanylate cyclase (GGDEF)-like protein
MRTEPVGTSDETADAVRRLEVVLDLARVGRTRPVTEVLEAVAQAVHTALGYATVVVNLYRPEWDDYAVVLVHGSAIARTELLGTTQSRELWERNLLRPEFERRRGVHFVSGHDEAWTGFDAVYMPDIPQTDDPGAWHPDDALLVSLRTTKDEPLGVLSVDEPYSGRRPTNDDLTILAAVCAHLSLALENAREANLAAWHRRTLADLLRVSSRLAVGRTREEVLSHVCATIVPRLGFEKVAVFLADGQVLELAAAEGWAGYRHVVSAPLSTGTIEELLARRTPADGCYIVGQADVRPDAGGYHSPRNGHGPLAWHDHWVLVPLRSRDGALRGVVVVDDPIDRMLPASERLQPLRLLADHSMSALEALDRLRSLRRMASFDPLTGVRNRRGLQNLIAELASGQRGVALMVCDLDEFKSVNDRYGHEVGDHVLERFGALLRAHARAGDIPVRLGGEEFCLVLPEADADGAMSVAERLREATVDRMMDLAPGLTVSIGVAATREEPEDANHLLARADQAMYAAKAAGRNRCRTAR